MSRNEFHQKLSEHVTAGRLRQAEADWLQAKELTERAYFELDALLRVETPEKPAPRDYAYMKVGAPVLWVQNKISEATCEEINRIGRKVADVPENPVTGATLQCFGTAESGYTAVYAPGDTPEAVVLSAFQESGVTLTSGGSGSPAAPAIPRTATSGFWVVELTPAYYPYDMGYSATCPDGGVDITAMRPDKAGCFNVYNEKVSGQSGIASYSYLGARVLCIPANPADVAAGLANSLESSGKTLGDADPVTSDSNWANFFAMGAANPWSWSDRGDVSWVNTRSSQASLRAGGVDYLIGTTYYFWESDFGGAAYGEAVGIGYGTDARTCKTYFETPAATYGALSHSVPLNIPKYGSNPDSSFTQSTTGWYRIYDLPDRDLTDLEIHTDRYASNALSGPGTTGPVIRYTDMTRGRPSNIAGMGDDLWFWMPEHPRSNYASGGFTWDRTYIIPVSSLTKAGGTHSYVTGTATVISPNGAAPTTSITSHDFGTVAVGSSASVTVQVTNSWAVTMPTMVYRVATVYGTNELRIESNTCGTSLPAGATCQITMSYWPGSTGPQFGALAVATGKTRSLVPIKGVGQ
jgi:hypothetical protein